MGNCSPSARLNRLASSSIASSDSSNTSTSTSTLTSKRYDVYNVDARLFKHSKGQLQITSTHLVLYQKNLLPPSETNSSSETRNVSGDESHIAVSWPLNSLRRYGYYKDIFLFESGRKSPTGEGLFAFKCHKAKLLNDNLHKIIFQNANSLYNSANGPQAAAVTPSPVEATSNHGVASTPNSTSEQTARPHYLNDTVVVKPKPTTATAKPTATTTSTTEYVNDTVIAGANLVRLPLALSSATPAPIEQPTAAAATATPKSQPTRPNQYYVNMSEVDANLLHLAQKLNSPKPPQPPPVTHKTNLSEYFKLNYFSILTGGSSNNNANGKHTPAKPVAVVESDSNVALNYIVPERIQLDNKKSGAANRESSLSSSSKDETHVCVLKSEEKPSQKSQVTSPTAAAAAASLVSAQTNKQTRNDINSQYCVIDPKKTSAATKTRTIAKEN